jgi:hypothetical protein
MLVYARGSRISSFEPTLRGSGARPRLGEAVAWSAVRGEQQSDSRGLLSPLQR